MRTNVHNKRDEAKIHDGCPFLTFFKLAGAEAGYEFSHFDFFGYMFNNVDTMVSSMTNGFFSH